MTRSLLAVLGLPQPLQKVGGKPAALRTGGSASPVSGLGGSAPSARKPVGAGSAQGPAITGDAAITTAAPDASPPTTIVFEPRVRLMTDGINTNSAPNVLRMGEPLTIDLFIENWEDEAPPALQAKWEVRFNDKILDAQIRWDSAAPFSCYLTITGKKTGGITVASVQVTITLPGFPPRTTDVASYAFACVAAAPEDQEVTDARRVDRGGEVSQTDLDQDLTNLLQDWLAAASTGISQFATSSLESKIRALSEPDKRAFLMSLVGNVLWAATVFNIGGGVVKLLNKATGTKLNGQSGQVPAQTVSFVLSLAGIGVPAVDSFVRAGAAAGTIDEVRRAMDGANQKWYQHMQVILSGKIQGIAAKATVNKRYEATNKICEVIFRPGTVKIDAKNELKPTINMSVVSNRYRVIATSIFEKYEADANRNFLERSDHKENREAIKKNQKPRWVE